MRESLQNPFEISSEGIPVYLVLLHLGADEVDTSLARLAEAIEQTVHVEDRVRSLLHESNWRSHLVGAIAALLLGNEYNFSDSLWYAFDRGSWVQPQLAVTASYTDPQFSENAISRLNTGCLVRVKKNWWRCALQKISGRNFDLASKRSAKGVASLLAVCGSFPAIEAQMQVFGQRKDIVAILEEDERDFGELATQWKSSLEAAFERYGKPLRPFEGHL